MCYVLEDRFRYFACCIKEIDAHLRRVAAIRWSVTVLGDQPVVLTHPSSIESGKASQETLAAPAMVP